ncbi:MULTISPECIES: carbonic anhydrase [unclassified Streptomyces]|uniref:carbonic anhydrase n=1 Tax=unclassified Streptomyces TaxID=2593676 RepID=UPI0011CE2956|nr:MULTISPECIES: carbonic anhydrase [unclassified Streptomyces]TXS54251.1 carbonic anhydrase [Streptomyces sp. me109]
MGVVETLTDRNADFAATRFTEGLRMMPNLKTIVIGCVDPRVDPASVLGAEPGDIAAIRNVGGRVTRRTLEELVMLRQVTRAAGGDLGPGWELIVLQHTHCGITLLQDRPELLTPYFATDEAGLAGQAIGDPRAAVAHDVAELRAETRLEGVRVSGLLYDVATGEVETVVAP